MLFKKVWQRVCPFLETVEEEEMAWQGNWSRPAPTDQNSLSRQVCSFLFHVRMEYKACLPSSPVCRGRVVQQKEITAPAGMPKKAHGMRNGGNNGGRWFI